MKRSELLEIERKRSDILLGISFCYEVIDKGREKLKVLDEKLEAAKGKGN